MKAGEDQDAQSQKDDGHPEDEQDNDKDRLVFDY